MAEKDVTNFNFSMPNPLAEEFRRIGDVHGERNKLRWAVAAAAVLRLLEMPEEERVALIQRIYGARHFPAALNDLVAQAKTKATSRPQETPAPAGRLAPPKAALAEIDPARGVTVREVAPPAPKTAPAAAPRPRARKA